jgi:hypothetical protein
VVPYLCSPYMLSWHEHGHLYSLGRMRHHLLYEAWTGGGYVLYSLCEVLIIITNHTTGKYVRAPDKRRNEVNLNVTEMRALTMGRTVGP